MQKFVGLVNSKMLARLPHKIQQMSTSSIWRVLIFVLLGNQYILRIDAKKAICKFEPIDSALGKEYKSFKKQFFWKNFAVLLKSPTERKVSRFRLYLSTNHTFWNLTYKNRQSVFGGNSWSTFSHDLFF